MPSPTYDAIVVGARCAGSPTAMLLARAGYRVLLVDRATFPSEALSTRFIHPTGVAHLERWGLLQQLEATGCPPISRDHFDLGAVSIDGSPHPSDGIWLAYAPRRTILDKLLLDAARHAGADVREAFSVEELIFEDGAVTGVRGRDAGGQPVVEHARIVIAADGRHLAPAFADAGYNKDPITAQGISDAFRDAELCVGGVQAWWKANCRSRRPADKSVCSSNRSRPNFV